MSWKTENTLFTYFMFVSCTHRYIIVIMLTSLCQKLKIYALRSLCVVHFLFFLPSVRVWCDAAICVLRRLNSRNSSSSFFRASSNFRLSSAWSFFSLSNFACNYVMKWGKLISETIVKIAPIENWPLFRFPWVRPPSLWHAIQTWLACHLLSSAIRPNDSIVLPQTFVGMTPTETQYALNSLNSNIAVRWAYDRRIDLRAYCRCRHQWIPFAPNAFAGTIHSAVYASSHAYLPCWCESTSREVSQNRNVTHSQLRKMISY